MGRCKMLRCSTSITGRLSMGQFLIGRNVNVLLGLQSIIVQYNNLDR